MSANRTFVKIRRGILQHIETRNLSPSEFAALMVIILSADKASGVWFGCSLALSAKFGGTLSSKGAKDILRSLETGGYVKRFRTHGQRGNYPILVNNYEITVGDLSAYLINTEGTTDWKNPAAHRVPDDVTESVPERVTDSVPLSRPTRPQDLDTSISQERKTLSDVVGKPEKNEKKLKENPGFPDVSGASLAAIARRMESHYASGLQPK
jgi:hypothetical protein